MGNPNNRGQPKYIPVAKVIEMGKMAKQQEEAAKKEIADKLSAEKKAKQKLEKNKVEEEKLAVKKATEENAKKIAATINFGNIHKHDALSLKQHGDAKQLVIQLNLCAKPPTDMLAVTRILPEYASAITNVQINLLAPTSYVSRALYNQHIQNMNKLMEQLNSFPLTKLNISIDINHHDSFQQLKLAAAVNGLVFQDWSMDYHIWNGDTFFPIPRYSSFGKRLRGVYRVEFGAI